jgi:hypothetical protein
MYQHKIDSILSIVTFIGLLLSSLTPSTAQRYGPFGGVEEHYDTINVPKSRLITVKIKFKNLIRGYRVSVTWHPLGMYHGVHGPAQITFRNPKTNQKHIYCTSYFNLPEEVLPKSFFKQGEYEFNHMASDTTLTFSYPIMEESIAEKKQVPSKMPFHFLDVNFDGKDELIIAEAGFAQRSGMNFTAYNFECDYNYFNDDVPMKIDYHMPLRERYGEFDYTARFDHKKKTMTVHRSASAFDGNVDIVYGFERLLPEDLVGAFGEGDRGLFIPRKVVNSVYGPAYGLDSSYYDVYTSPKLRYKHSVKPYVEGVDPLGVPYSK